ncbi:hypothetical protein MKX01_013002 [Papaver californicum]|nr:hypothetical protein MKX01_013002 [Papaver californicum]
MSTGKFDFAFVTSLMVLTLAFLIHFSQHKNYLAAHNAARGNLSVGIMTWDDNLATYAMNYAKQRAGDCKIIQMDPMVRTLLRVILLPSRQSTNYNYGANSCNTGKECGHYTQIVWRESVHVGCTRIVCTNGGTFVVYEYDPPGNWDGEYPY